MGHVRSSASEEVLMSIESSSTASRLGEFEIHLRTHRYAAAIQRRYLWIAQRFVDYLGRQCIAVEAAHAPEFLPELGPRGGQESLAHLGVRDIDAYLQQRCKGLRRRTIEGYTVCLRSFLRYLHGSGRTALDLSSTVIGPRIYDDEQVPSALRPEEVQTVLEATRQDYSPIGRRDYAFLMLLATYGLRAGEIVTLRL